jgi:RHS repeat-associated protein
MIDSSGNTVNEYAYDAWGTMTVVKEAVYNPWRYAAGFHDTTTGLTKFGARYHDPNLGRWTQRDPSGMDQNPYAYSNNNGVTFTDPTGYGVLDVISEAVPIVDDVLTVLEIATSDDPVREAASAFFGTTVAALCLGSAVYLSAGTATLYALVGYTAAGAAFGEFSKGLMEVG